MEHKTIYPEIRPENVVIPKGATLESWLNSRIARHETRSLDWDALKFGTGEDGHLVPPLPQRTGERPGVRLEAARERLPDRVAGGADDRDAGEGGHCSAAS